METLVRKIRTLLGLNQAQFSQLLGVSAVTVNRWEHAKAIPNLLAQKQLYEFVKAHHVPLADFILAEVRRGGDEHTLFHASRSGIEGAIRPASRSKCDFGKGFYMGTDPLQPLTLVCNETNPVLYTLDIDLKGLRCLEIDVDIDWAMLIAYFRGYMDRAKGSTLYNKYAQMAQGYDVIIGYIADDRMYQVLTDFFEERITDRALLGSLSALKLGRQYVAVTEYACEKITIRKEKRLSQLELMALKDLSIQRRNEGLQMASRIVKEHRRDGRFFDEIVSAGES